MVKDRRDRRQWMITGYGKLSQTREQISGLMTYEEAEKRLQREQENRRYQRYRTHTKLRIEYNDSVQLTIQFQPGE